MEYKLNEPMTWNQFKEMPHDLQQEYLDHLKELFHVSKNRIARELFHTNPTFLSDLAKENGLRIPSMQGYTRTTGNWDAFVNCVKKAPVDAVDPKKDAIEPEVPGKTEPQISILRMSFTVKTREDAIQMLQTLDFPEGVHFTITAE